MGVHSCQENLLVQDRNCCGTAKSFAESGRTMVTFTSPKDYLKKPKYVFIVDHIVGNECDMLKSGAVYRKLVVQQSTPLKAR